MDKSGEIERAQEIFNVLAAETEGTGRLDRVGDAFGERDVAELNQHAGRAGSQGLRGSRVERQAPGR
ncbi:MAG TPA: hypothetical protein VKV17_15145 [Bryobacteraceae bacterium]|nr:hypothetical protein [Bryobacteraceae bacterium]